MFTKEEVKKFIIKYGNKLLFPNFYNKVTWSIVCLGSGVIVTPTPLKLVIYNWLIESFNLNSGQLITLADMNANSADYWLGFCLIIAALIHNILSKWLLNEDVATKRKESERITEVDKALFQEFLEIFPSGSRSSYLLETHDFGNSFRLESLHDIDKFVNEWNCPEKKFIDPKLESLRHDFWTKCNEFSWLLAEKSSPTAVGMQSVVPDRHRDDWNWPDWVENDVKAVNEMASEVFKLHQEFIQVMRLALKC